FSESFGLRKAAGRVCAGLLRFEESKDFLEAVHARNTADPEISYYLGIACDGIGRMRDARESYEGAARMPEFRAAGALKLGELWAREGNPQKAASYLELATAAAPNDFRAAEESIAVLRAEGQKEKAQKLAEEWLARAGQSYFLMEQIGRPDLQHLANDTDRV